MTKKMALGKGLGALIDDASSNNVIKAGNVNEIPIDNIEINPFQPRKEFEEDALNELATSIKELGIIQPITVREISPNKYQLITGERRFRASKIVGLETIPAFVRKANDTEMLEMALVENIQREDLNAIEIALSYNRLIEECKLTQETLSDKVGKKRSTIANYLRLLRLPAIIQIAIKDKKLSMGHARAIVTIEDTEAQLMLFDQIIKNDYSVRKIEELVRNIDQIKAQKKEKKTGKTETEYKELQNHLEKYFQSKIELKRNEKGKGKIIIHFQSDEGLEKIIGILDKINS